MNKFVKVVLACVLGAGVATGMFTGCANREEKPATDVTTIYIGTHAQSEDDPNWVNSVTGEASMSADRMRAALAALETVKEELGVDIEWKSWPNSVTQDILQTVLAGDPYSQMEI